MEDHRKMTLEEIMIATQKNLDEALQNIKYINYILGIKEDAENEKKSLQ